MTARPPPYPPAARPTVGGRATSRILLVEDDDGIARPLVAALRAQGHDVERVADGAGALAAADATVDLVVLDLGLPDLDGVEVCRRVRRGLGLDVPILVLTARTAEADVVVALDAGADDYVTKPFRLAELQARIRALLRRHGADDAELRVQDLRLSPASRRAWRGERELELTPTEFELLETLLRRPGAVVERRDVLRRVLGVDGYGYGASRTLDVHMSSLRRKLGDDPSDPRYITTVRGVGYRMETGG